MTHKVGPEGQVVIPKDLRDEFDAEHGSRPLKGRFAGRSLVDQLERDRAADRQREEAR